MNEDLTRDQIETIFKGPAPEEEHFPSEEIATPTPSTAARDVHQQAQDVAIAIGEDPSTLSVRQDVGEVLEQMQEGVIITLHIKRPRFTSQLTLEDLGLQTTSEEASQVLADYFQLGRRSLLPKTLQDRLGNAEKSARFALRRYSFKSHWGLFVPVSNYEDWKDDNKRLEQEFWDVRDAIVNDYDNIIDQVVEDHRPLAEDAWRRVTFSQAIAAQQSTSYQLLEEIVQRLHAEEGREQFIRNYLACIRAAMPQRDEIEHDFEYRIERGIIPLPSLVARDMEASDRIYRERAVKDARTRAELEAIEAQRRAELQKLSWEQQQEQEIRRKRLQAERDREILQEAMERDILEDTRRQKERLVTEFYTGIVQQINNFIAETANNILTSIEKNNGVLRGPVSVQLSNLVTQLETMNFVHDRKIEDQIAQLSSVLPSQEESEKEKRKKGSGRIDTTRITQVIRAVGREAEQVLIDLDTQPRKRTRRDQPLAQAGAIDLNSRRRTRAGSVTVEPSEQPAAKHRQRRTL